jgi:hypothetical protein
VFPWLSRRRDAEPDAAGDAQKVRIAARQLERAEDYVAAAIGVELADPERRCALHELRLEVLAVQDLLLRPRRGR